MTAVPTTAVSGRQGGRRDPAAEAWRGPKRPYDLVKEFVIALAVVTAIVAVVAGVFSSPDDKGITLQRWAQQDPGDFVATATTELDGTSTSASYGPPYNHNSDGQSIFFLHLQRWAGVRHPVDSAQDFVLRPLSTVRGNPKLTEALARYNAASASQQQAWATAYDKAIASAPDNDPTKVAQGDYGPVPVMTAALQRLADSGALDTQLVNHGSGFYQNDYTKPLLFIADGGYLDDLAGAQHLHGDQWGMMNETGSYPGQAWLWLYTMWYQIAPFNSSGNADALVWGIMMVLSAALILVPFIPGLRSLPRWLPLYRIIWRDYYRDHPWSPRPTTSSTPS